MGYSTIEERYGFYFETIGNRDNCSGEIKRLQFCHFLISFSIVYALGVLDLSSHQYYEHLCEQNAKFNTSRLIHDIKRVPYDL